MCLFILVQEEEKFQDLYYELKWSEDGANGEEMIDKWKKMDITDIGKG